MFVLCSTLCVVVWCSLCVVCCTLFVVFCLCAVVCCCILCLFIVCGSLFVFVFFDDVRYL